MNTALFDKYRVSELTTKAVKATERGELLREMMEVVNLTRSQSGIYKPLTMARMGVLVAHLQIPDLYYLLSICKDAGNRAPHYATGFSKCFFYQIRAQKDK